MTMPEPDPGLQPDAVEEEMERSPSLRQTTVRGLSLAGIGYATSQLLNFAAYLALARLLDPTDFGLYAAGTLITGVGGLFAESGMLAALIKRDDRLPEAASTATAVLVASGVLLTLGSLALSPLIGLAFHSRRVGDVTAVLSGWLLIRALGIVPDAMLQRSFSFARRVIVDPLGVIAYAGAAITLAAVHAGVWALVGGAYASILVETAGAWLACDFRPHRDQVSFAMYRELARYTRPLVAGEILRRVASEIDVFTLGRFAGPAPLGQYRNGMLLAQQPGNAFGSVASYVVLPAFARISHSSQRVTAAVREALGLTYATVLPLSAACLPLGVPVAVLLLGGRYRIAGAVIAGLSGSVIATTVLSVCSEMMKAIGEVGTQLRVNALWLASLALFVSLGAILYGPVEAAVGYSIGSWVTAAWMLRRSARSLGLGPWSLLAGLPRPLIASAAMAGALYGADAAFAPTRHGELTGVLLLAAEIGIGVVVYVGLLAAIEPAIRPVLGRIAARLRFRG